MGPIYGGMTYSASSMLLLCNLISFITVCACASTCPVHLERSSLRSWIRQKREKLDAAQLAREFEALTEEDRTLKLAQSPCVEQLEKLRISIQEETELVLT